MASIYVDKRILHVSNTYAQYENMSPAEILKQAHDRIREKYYRTANGQGGVGAGSADEAAVLNEFFQAIKIYMRNPDSDFLTQEKKTIVMNVLSRARAMRGKGKQLFFNTDSGTGKQRGDAAEKDLATIMQSVFDEVAGASAEKSNAYGSLILGDAYVNVVQNDQINVAAVDKIAKSMIQVGAKKTYDQIMNGKKEDKFTQVQGKIDVSGMMANVEISMSASSYLTEVATLLNKASFSVKSYTSMTFDKELKQRVESKVTKLHLGQTNQRRIFEDILGELGIPNKVSLSMLYWVKKTKNKSAKSQASDLIFAYELTGYGQKYVNQAIQDVLSDLGVDGANYFLYNDPSTDQIYVRSTAELIMTMWGHVDELLQKGSTTLNKSIFYNQF